MDGERAPWLEGYRVKIIDGNCLEASEHRIQELREATGRALPGKSLVVYAPAQGALHKKSGHKSNSAVNQIYSISKMGLKKT